jgi:O-antigen/teichoic acid export membrane protein
MTRRSLTGARSLAPKQGIGVQAISLAGATGFAQALIAVIYLYAARASAPDQFGMAVTAIALGTSAAGFIDFGTNSFWVREVVRKNLTVKLLGDRLFGKLYITALIASFWCLTCMIAFTGSLLWTAGPIMFGLVLNQACQVPLRANAQGVLVAFSVLADRVAALLIFMILIACGVSSISALWPALVAGCLTASIMGWTMSSSNFRPSVTFWIKSNPWKGAGFFGMAGLANSVQALDLALLSLISGPAAAGLYGAVNRWTQPMTMLASAFSSAAAPFVAKSSNILHSWLHIRRGLWIPCAAIALSFFVFLFAPWIVTILLGSAYADSAPILQILSVVSILSIISQPIFVSLQAIGRDKYVAVCMVITVCVQIILVAVLAPPFGVLGAAWAALSMQTLLTCFLATAIWREIRKQRRLSILNSPSA